MRYNKTNKPVMCMQTQSKCYKNTSTMEIKGILWQSINTNNVELKNYIQPSDNSVIRTKMLSLIGENLEKSDINHTSSTIGANSWIGKVNNGTVSAIQTMPWNYRSWNNSYSNGWIQIMLCEDEEHDEEYFNSVYTEACELSAYLCDVYNIDPRKSIEIDENIIPTILENNLSNWFSNFNKSIENIRKDIIKILNNANSAVTEIEEMKVYEYFVRKSWEEAESQIGEYENFEDAKTICDLEEGYEVYDVNGISVYPNLPAEEEAEQITNILNIKDEVEVVSGATFTSGKIIPEKLIGMKMYVRRIENDNNIVIGTKPYGAITGIVKSNFLIPYVEKEIPEEEKEIETKKRGFEEYLVRVAVPGLNVRSGPSTGYKIREKITKNQVFSISNEKNGWGYLKTGAGWIDLRYVRKI